MSLQQTDGTMAIIDIDGLLDAYSRHMRANDNTYTIQGTGEVDLIVEFE